MNDPRTPDRLLAAWFEADAPASAPDALKTDIYRATARIRPVPPWLARMRGNPMDVILGGAGRRNSRLVPVFALLLLTLALVAGGLVIISQRRDEMPVIVPPSTLPSSTLPPADPVPSVAPAFQAYADLAVSMPYRIRQVQPGNYIGVAGPDTDELLRSIHRFDPSDQSSTLVIDDIPAGPSDHVSFTTYGNVVVIGHDEGNRALRFDARSGEFLGETRLGTRPLEPIVWDEGDIAFPNFGDGAVSLLDAVTGTVEAVPIPAFNGNGPLSLITAHSGLWAVSPSAPVLVGIGRMVTSDTPYKVSPRAHIEAGLPGGPHCGVGFGAHQFWVTGCDGSSKVVVLPDTYISSSKPRTIDVAPGVLAPAFEYDGRVWFPAEDRSSPTWTTKLVPVDSETLALGEPIDLGDQVNVVQAGANVWITSKNDLYQVRLDSLPSD
jgi:hypothetical protein